MLDNFTIRTTEGVVFTCEAGQTILDAAEKCGVVLPYSCKTGQCSTCKCRVISGLSVTQVAEIGLSTPEMQNGWVLSCVRSPKSDMLVEVENLSDLILPKPRTLPCRIQSLKRLSNYVIEVKLRLPPSGSNFSYLPGQYIDLIGPNGIRRSYSLASAKGEYLELHVGYVEHGFMSSYWFDAAKTNDLLRLYGPLGTFFLRDFSNLDLVFLATGTGIAPVKAMLESLKVQALVNRPRSVSVYWGVRTEQDLYLNLSNFIGDVRYVPVLSRSDSTWAGVRGYVQQQFIRDFADCSMVAVMAAGSSDMVSDARTLCHQFGLPGSRFFADAFVSSSIT